MDNKKQKVNLLIERLKKISSNSLKKKDYNCAMSAISFASETLYSYNQYYVDDELEQLTKEVANKIKDEKHFGNSDFYEKSETILVYDGFGLDTRGVILMYLNALGMNHYKVCYVTNSAAKTIIPTITAICNKFHMDMKFIDMKDYHDWCIQLSDVFEEIKPKASFFYTTPYDVSGCASFYMYKNLSDRFLIDLTDHAFWLGKCSSDYFLGSREMSAYIQHFQRGIPKNKCIKLGVNLLVENIQTHEGLPFDVVNEKYVFSGGSLYKTLGDEEKKYYKIVNHILSNHPDVKFIYAGTGDDTELKKVVAQYPGRVYHIAEREDFYYLIENSVIYLNTYPMFGGMMMKYAAYAHRLPITLKHGSDSDGLLLHQKECAIEYDDYESLVKDVDRLLEDENYRKEREKLLDGAVITEERFKKNVRSVIENHNTDYMHNFEELDTMEFRSEYFERFDYRQNLNSICKRIRFSLFKYFPFIFFKGFISRIKNKKLE